jgi:hypothetical protein
MPHGRLEFLVGRQFDKLACQRSKMLKGRKAREPSKNILRLEVLKLLSGVDFTSLKQHFNPTDYLASSNVILEYCQTLSFNLLHSRDLNFQALTVASASAMNTDFEPSIAFTSATDPSAAMRNWKYTIPVIPRLKAHAGYGAAGLLIGSGVHGKAWALAVIESINKTIVQIIFIDITLQ